jgi:hypothetical protein
MKKVHTWVNLILFFPTLNCKIRKKKRFLLKYLNENNKIIICESLKLALKICFHPIFAKINSHFNPPNEREKTKLSGICYNTKIQMACHHGKP